MARRIAKDLAPALILLVVGFLLVVTVPRNEFGAATFLVLPAAVGFVSGLTARRGKWAPAYAAATVGFFLVCLVAFGPAGILCGLMASPIVLLSAVIGSGVGALLRSVDERGPMTLAPLIALAAVYGATLVEDQTDPTPRREVVRTAIEIDAPIETVWGAVTSLHDVDGPKPLLMRLGLPVPTGCTTEGRGVGTERTCHFDAGSVRERVTRWEPPCRYAMVVEEVDLPGRPWLGFESAAYELVPLEDGRTRVVRTTTLTSTLRPGPYWRVFERLGTETEHRYVLAALAARVDASED